jgi:hypothetical protein
LAHIVGGARSRPFLYGAPVLWLVGAHLLLSAAQGAGPRASLHYVQEPAPAPCRSQRELEGRVIARLGYDPFAGEAPLHLTATIAATERGLAATIRTEAPGAPPRSRRFETAGTDCAELLESVALALALAIDPLSQLRPAERRLVVTPRADDASTAPSAPALHASVGVGVFATVGLLPQPAVAGSLVGALHFAGWTLNLAAFVSPPWSTQLAGVEVRSTTAGADVFPCLVAGRWSGCALVSVAAVWSQPIGVDATQTAVTPFVGIGARGSVTFSLTEVFKLEPWIQVVARPVGVSLLLHEQVIWSAPPVCASLGVTLHAEFL